MLHVYLIVRFCRKDPGFERALTWSHRNVAQLAPWASLRDSLSTTVVQFMLHTIRHPLAGVVRRSESVKSKQIEKPVGDRHKPWLFPIMSCLVKPRGVVASPCVEYPQQRRLVQRVSTAELLLPAEVLPVAAAA